MEGLEEVIRTRHVVFSHNGKQCDAHETLTTHDRWWDAWVSNNYIGTWDNWQDAFQAATIAASEETNQ